MGALLRTMFCAGPPPHCSLHAECMTVTGPEQHQHKLQLPSIGGRLACTIRHAVNAMAGLHMPVRAFSPPVAYSGLHLYSHRSGHICITNFIYHFIDQIYLNIYFIIFIYTNLKLCYIFIIHISTIYFYTTHVAVGDGGRVSASQLDALELPGQLSALALCCGQWSAWPGHRCQYDLTSCGGVCLAQHQLASSVESVVCACDPSPALFSSPIIELSSRHKQSLLVVIVQWSPHWPANVQPVADVTRTPLGPPLARAHHLCFHLPVTSL